MQLERKFLLILVGDNVDIYPLSQSHSETTTPDSFPTPICLPKPDIVPLDTIALSASIS